MTRTIPTPREWPLLGSLPTLLLDNMALKGKLGDISLIHIGPQPVVVFSRADYCHEVLTRLSDFDKPRDLTAPGRRLLGDGLISIENRIHPGRRRFVQPAFQHQRLAPYATAITTYTEEVAANWHPGEVIDIHQAMMTLTMRIIGKVMFDVADLGSLQLGQDVTNILEYLRASFLLPLPRSWPLPRNVRLRRSLPRLHGAIRRMIAERRQEGQDRGDLLSMLLLARDEAGQGLPDQQIRAEAMTVFLAGHETTALTLTWAWDLLSRHPGPYQRLRQEVTQALAGQSPTLSDLPRLPYALQVFKEAQRLYPPAHTLIRMTIRDTTIDSYRIPKGTMIMLDLYSMHRRPDYFSRPNHFDPERFTPEHEARIPPYAYIPFGSGPRGCIGRGLALLEGQLILATLAQRGRLEATTPHPVKPHAGITMRPRRAIRLVTYPP